MKLVVITCLKDFQKDVGGILFDTGIEVFSVSETLGFKNHQIESLKDNWFSRGREHFDSIFLFSFTQDDKADHLLNAIQAYNNQHVTDFPIRGFVLPVDKASHEIR